MDKFTPVDEAFFYLWNHGQRFISEEDKNSMNYGIYKNSNGKIEGYTINGLKRFETVSIKGFDLTPEELELGINYIKFKRSLKENNHAEAKRE
jgi:hypothetical protein